MMVNTIVKYQVIQESIGGSMRNALFYYLTTPKVLFKF